MALVAMCCGASYACPPGYKPSLAKDYMGCAPDMPAYGSGGDGGGPSMPPDPGPRWEFRWGAIAADRESGQFGGSENHKTPSAAQAAAIGICRKNGGSSSCKVQGTYHNSCGAMAYGTRSYVVYSGSATEEVKKASLAACSKITEDCQIYYLGCSFPVEK